MKIVCDKHIPFFAETIQKEWPNVQIIPMESEQIDATSVREADVLVVRTRTKVDETLLSGSRIQMVCTATIGHDHIDTAYCKAHDIRWTACPGCNAQAVCDYIEEALNEQSAISNQQSVIGVVGVGHVGSLVAQMAERRGLKVLLNDPPKNIGVSLDEIAQNCDIITFHVPLTPITNNQSPITNHQSPITNHPTYHLCDEAFLSKCKPEALIINSARGGVVDEQALLASGHPYIIDTWENEPTINKNVLAHAQLASMHIAGYSAEGKRNASQMCLDAIAQQFGLQPVVVPAPTEHGDTTRGWLRRISEALKARPDDFESLRKNYKFR